MKITIYDNTGLVKSTATSGGGADNLSDLNDITLLDLAENDLLVRGAFEWENKAIGDFANVSPAGGDKLLAADASDSENLKHITVQGIIDLVPGGVEELDDLTDVVITTPAQNDLLIRGATTWENKAIGDLTAATPATGDKIILADVDDSENLKSATIQGIIDLVPAPPDTLDELTDVAITTPAQNDLLIHGASTWENKAIGDLDSVTAATGDSALIADASDGGNLKRVTALSIAQTLLSGLGDGILKVVSGVLSVVTAPTGDIVGTSDSQTLTNKTLTTPVLTLEQGAAVAPTAEGRIAWDTDDDVVKVGDGTGTKTLLPDGNAALISNKTSVSAATGDEVLIADASDSGILKRATVDSIAALAGGGALYDSGWVAVSNGVQKVLTHGLGAPPGRITVWHATDASGADCVLWVGTAWGSGLINLLSVRANGTTITVGPGNWGALSQFDVDGGYLARNHGYCRVVAQV